MQQLIQDVIAPDVRELKVRLASFEKQMDVRFAAIDVRFNAMDEKMDVRFAALDQKMDIQFRTIMATIAESKAQTELINLSVIPALSERVAVLEARAH